MSVFWRNWLSVWCGAVALFGVVLAGGGLEATSGPVRMVFDLLNGPGELTFDPYLRFSVALLGAVTIGWSITVFAAIQAAIQLGDSGRRTWMLLIVSAVCWYVIDCTLSTVTGFALNVVPNTILLTGLLIPILRSGVLKR